MSSTPDTVTIPDLEKPLHKNELLKAESNFLRGNIVRELADTSTGTISEESAQLTKFHGDLCGSRCSIWNFVASYSVSSFGSRFSADHIQVD